jgi:hypothetical protein
MTPEITDADALRYLAAESIETPAGRLDHAEVVAPTGDTLGGLEGILINPVQHRARFFVVASRHLLRTRHYLLPFEGSRMVPEHGAVQVEVEPREVQQMPQVPPSAFRTFSDDDLVTLMFSTNAA